MNEVYVTLKVQPKLYQLSFEDMLNGVTEKQLNATMTDQKNTFDTKTKPYKNVPKRLMDAVNFKDIIEALKDFCDRHKELIETEDKSTLFKSFKIPKRSGGLRPIDAPLDPLMNALRDLKHIFESKCFASYHTSAFAYISGRSTIDAVRRHQANNSRWFLKLDFHNFFGCTTPEFLRQQLQKIFPFSEIYKDLEGATVLEKALSLCFLNGGLPQGTPVSPMLTNIMMIPVDYEISKMMREHTPHIIYTRYADDIILSSDLSFKWTEVQQLIIDKVKEYNAPFELNTKKTRYGSSAGRNWNLGVMLNKDNEITVGHVKKKFLKAKLFTLMTDYTNGNRWDISDVQELQGQISYYKMVEKDKIEKILNDYSEKFNRSVEDLIKSILRNEI